MVIITPLNTSPVTYRLPLQMCVCVYWAPAAAQTVLSSDQSQRYSRFGVANEIVSPVASNKSVIKFKTTITVIFMTSSLWCKVLQHTHTHACARLECLFGPFCKNTQSSQARTTRFTAQTQSQRNTKKPLPNSVFVYDREGRQRCVITHTPPGDAKVGYGIEMTPTERRTNIQSNHFSDSPSKAFSFSGADSFQPWFWQNWCIFFLSFAFLNSCMPTPCSVRRALPEKGALQCVT